MSIRSTSQKSFVAFYLDSVFHGERSSVICHQRIDLVSNAIIGQWKHTKLCGTLCMTMVDLSDKGLLCIWNKISDVAYQDVLNEFDLVWCVKRSYCYLQQFNCYLES